jgi:thioredoxin-like negative regulator of GroEL
MLAWLGACASFGGSDGRTLKFQDDVTVTQAGGNRTTVAKGEAMPMPNVPVHVEAPGRVGVLVVPTSSAAGETLISLKPVEDWGGPQLNRLVNARLNEVLSRVVDAQKMLGSGRAKDALATIEDLQTRNPELTYLNFIKASCLVVLGERDRARSALDAALSAFPDNESGRALAASIIRKSP